MVLLIIHGCLNSSSIRTTTEQRIVFAKLMLSMIIFKHSHGLDIAFIMGYYIIP